MTQEALKMALEALDNLLYWDNGKPEYDEAREAITAIKEALAQPELCKYGQEPKLCTSSPMDCQCAIDAALAQPEQETVGYWKEHAQGLQRDYDSLLADFQAQQEERNFCPRCGKRTKDIHTCTPPQPYE